MDNDACGKRVRPGLVVAGVLAGLWGVGLASPALACPDCALGRQVRAEVLGPGSLTFAGQVVLPMMILAGVVAGVHRIGRRATGRAASTPAEAHGPLDHGPLIAAALSIGVGMGGFVDGIVFHQLLQWHNMLSSRLPPVDLTAVKVNMLWDGLFHAFTWLTTAVGIGLLWRAGRRAVPWSTPVFVGGLSLGWGLFNLVEGVVDHLVLGLHHVHPGANQLAWDVGFLAAGALLAAAGAGLIRHGVRSRRLAVQ
jgi:uncharacterized membrane protein